MLVDEGFLAYCQSLIAILFAEQFCRSFCDFERSEKPPWLCSAYRFLPTVEMTEGPGVTVSEQHCLQSPPVRNAQSASPNELQIAARRRRASRPGLPAGRQTEEPGRNATRALHESSAMPQVGQEHPHRRKPRERPVLNAKTSTTTRRPLRRHYRRRKRWCSRHW
jgi:hypothetical protein